MSIRVAIVEDDEEIRQGLAYLVGKSSGFECVGAFESAEQALPALPPLRANVVLMDIRLPGMSGIECIERLKTKSPATQIMMLTVFDDHDKIFQSLAAGATGYLLKNTPPEKLVEAIRELDQGGSPMSTQIARRVVQVFQQAPKASSAVGQLSVREQQILNHLAQGFLYKEIAEKLNITMGTVRTHVFNIYRTLQVRTRTQAILKLHPNRRVL